MPNKYCMLARLLGRGKLGATTTFIKHITNQHFYWNFDFRDISQSVLGRFWQFKDQNIGFFVENANVSRIHENITMLKIWKVCKYSLNSISKFKPTLLLGTHRYYLFRANMPKYRFYLAFWSMYRWAVQGNQPGSTRFLPPPAILDTPSPGTSSFLHQKLFESEISVSNNFCLHLLHIYDLPIFSLIVIAEHKRDLQDM